MHLRPLRIGPVVEERVLNVIGVLTFPLWGPFAGFVIAVCWLGMKLAPPARWHRSFAWLPVKCDSWPEDGFGGTVWLETLWRSNGFYGVQHQREEPTKRQRETAKRLSAARKEQP